MPTCTTELKTLSICVLNNARTWGICGQHTTPVSKPVKLACNASMIACTSRGGNLSTSCGMLTPTMQASSNRAARNESTTLESVIQAVQKHSVAKALHQQACYAIPQLQGVTPPRNLQRLQPQLCQQYTARCDACAEIATLAPCKQVANLDMKTCAELAKQHLLHRFTCPRPSGQRQLLFLGGQVLLATYIHCQLAAADRQRSFPLRSQSHRSSRLRRGLVFCPGQCCLGHECKGESSAHRS